MKIMSHVFFKLVKLELYYFLISSAL